MSLNRRYAFPARDAAAEDSGVERDSRLLYKEKKPKISIRNRLISMQSTSIPGHRLIAGLLTLFITVILLSSWKSRAPSVARSLYLRSYVYYQDDGPPSSLVAVSKRTRQFQKVPEEYHHKVYVDVNNGNYETAVRAFRSLGWKLTAAPEHAQFVYDKYAREKQFERLVPWQRYSQYPAFQFWEDKYTFTKGILTYYKENPNEPKMIPETFLLDSEERKQKFLHRLETQGGYNEPWVLKVPDTNNAKGITMLGPNTEELYNVSRQVKEGWDDYDDDTFYQENRLVIQSYTCNELTWYHNFKFDLRFYWMVASIDPLIVLYHDGCARVSGISYNESDWSSTTNHLTFNTDSVEEELGTMNQYKQRIHDYYNEHSQELSHIQIDPVQHVKNQLKASIAQTVAAFKDVTFGNDEKHRMAAENAFQLNGADFVIDNNLDVWYIEPQAGPGMPEEYNFRVELHAELLCSMITIAEEIQLKQEADPKANLLPLKNLGNWEVIYVDEWQYRYEGYKRPTTKNACGPTAVEASDVVDTNVAM